MESTKSRLLAARCENAFDGMEIMHTSSGLPLSIPLLFHCHWAPSDYFSPLAQMICSSVHTLRRTHKVNLYISLWILRGEIPVLDVRTLSVCSRFRQCKTNEWTYYGWCGKCKTCRYPPSTIVCLQQHMTCLFFSFSQTCTVYEMSSHFLLVDFAGKSALFSCVHLITRTEQRDLFWTFSRLVSPEHFILGGKCQ